MIMMMQTNVFSKILGTVLLLVGIINLGAIHYAQPAAASSSLPMTIVADSHSDACAGLEQVDSSQGCDSSGNTIGGITKNVVNILSVLAGATAIIMIIVSGFRFMTVLRGLT
jgi:hypothetical protein